MGAKSMWNGVGLNSCTQTTHLTATCNNSSTGFDGPFIRLHFNAYWCTVAAIRTTELDDGNYGTARPIGSRRRESHDDASSTIDKSTLRVNVFKEHALRGKFKVELFEGRASAQCFK